MVMKRADLGIRGGFISEHFYGISKVNLVRKFGIDPIKEADESRRLSGGFMAPPVCRHLASDFLHEENIFRDKFALNPIEYENAYLLSLSDSFSLVSAAPHPPDGKELYDCNYASLMICLPPPAHQPARVLLPQPAARFAPFRASAVVVTGVNFARRLSESDCRRAQPASASLFIYFFQLCGSLPCCDLLRFQSSGLG